jgi:hypothetical protein
MGPPKRIVGVRGRSDDKVIAKYEGVVGEDELRKKLASLGS